MRLLLLFLRRRTIWWPTWPGWAALLLMIGAPILLWWFKGEAFFSLTERQPSDILIVEGWIGIDGVHAAKAEFDGGGYRYLVTVGGSTHTRWGSQQWNYAIEAQKLLLHAGVPPTQVIEAPAQDVEGQRTYEAAATAWRILRAKGIKPRSINVFTLGAHARRSRLVFAKIFGSGMKVGAVAWVPPGYETEPWWKSSERAADLIKETAGYLFELLLNSGRTSNSPVRPEP